MTLFRLTPRRERKSASAPLQAEAIFRRFFMLIARLERPHRRAAPEIKARITRLDEPPTRHS
jgi:hypothetical protein